MTTTLTVDAFSQLINNKFDLYETCVRNWYYLPKLKNSVVTEDYMRFVMNKQSFCPKYPDTG